MRVTVRLFGSLREAAGSRTIDVELPAGAKIEALREAVAARLPSAAKLGPRVAVAVNQQLASPGAVLADGDEVALLPPVSGGAGRCTLSDRQLDVDEVVRRVAGDDSGGVVTFLGQVRDRSRGRAIDHLEYEAYPGMAERELERIAEEAAERWPGVRVAVAHRTGVLAIGELAVVVVAASAHRGEAFEACRFAIDTLKERVPIWKKEVATDGAYWVEDHA
ncbi:MAG: molybdenum cofactor biosynthesis protein MoaE [Deltaproteobacteria bacterium]|nr:molybdenum cofactor biosynthesis protein MoaE [Deltaproteobacteria bacterium]